MTVREVKLACGCYGVEAGSATVLYRVTASAFLCPHRHNQGELTQVLPAPKQAARSGEDTAE